MLNFVSIIITSMVGVLSFIGLDYIWLSKIAKEFYLGNLRDHITVENGSLVPYFPAIPLVYIVAIVGIWLFVLPKATHLSGALLWGSLFGFLMYAFYDFTNLATLKDYPWTLTIADVIWGTIVVGIISVIMFWINSLIS
jgi:uncharacterized membrane protein